MTGREDAEKKEWWILKPGMSERGQGIRLFSSEEELTGIFEGWDPESDDEDENEARSDAGATSQEKQEDGKGIITSQLRHFIAQPYIHPPLLLSPPSSKPSPENSPDTLRKFHIRTYVLCVGALKVYVYKPMLALFAARQYIPPWDQVLQDDLEEAMKSHLTNTCLQDTNEREGSVGLFWSLPESLPTQAGAVVQPPSNPGWKDDMFEQICGITGEVFEAAARSMGIHFQPLPNAFELFGLDFMVGIEGDGELRTWLLEVNAFPDFRQTGGELKGLVGELFEGVVEKGIKPFFGVEEEKANENMVQALDIDLGRR